MVVSLEGFHQKLTLLGGEELRVRVPQHLPQMAESSSRGLLRIWQRLWRIEFHVAQRIVINILDIESCKTGGGKKERVSRQELINKDVCRRKN